jgi:acetamidase/formamidase
MTSTVPGTGWPRRQPRIGHPPAEHHLALGPDTVHWGFLDRSLRPAIVVDSGATVSMDTVTHHAGYAPDLMLDEELAELFATVTDRGPGPHLLSGPIAVAGARPGDVVQIDVLGLSPRHLHGTNLAAPWGLLRATVPVDVVTAWVIEPDDGVARPAWSYDGTGLVVERGPGAIVGPDDALRVSFGTAPSGAGATTPVPRPGPTDSRSDATGSTGPRSDATGSTDSRSDATGPTDSRSHATGPTSSTQILVPLRPHLGIVAVAPKEPGRHSSVPPGEWGGNIDDWRGGIGTTWYLPVSVDGALVSLGDPHVAQGDGEIDGTALEASLDVTVRLQCRRDLPFDRPVLETQSSLIVHGFGDDLDAAAADAATGALAILGRISGLSAPAAYGLLSVAADMGVTQVVDGRVGAHCTLPKTALGLGAMAQHR